MSIIINFPKEILLEIFRYVPKQDYISLALVCKKIKELLKEEILWIPDISHRTERSVHDGIVDVLCYGTLDAVKMLVKVHKAFFKDVWVDTSYSMLFFRTAIERKNREVLHTVYGKNLVDAYGIVVAANKIIEKNDVSAFEKILSLKNDPLIWEGIRFFQVIIPHLIFEKNIRSDLLEVIYKNEHWDLIDEIFDTYIVPKNDNIKQYNQITAFRNFNEIWQNDSIMIAMTYGVKMLQCLFSFQVKYHQDYITREQLWKAAKSGVTLIRKMISGNERYKNKI